MDKKILHLTLDKKWFDLIASGEKKEEYREQKVYWDQRLLDSNGHLKRFDEIHARNGYGKDQPFIRVEWSGCTVFTSSKLRPMCGEPLDKRKFYYVIGIGKILEIKNHKLATPTRKPWVNPKHRNRGIGHIR